MNTDSVVFLSCFLPVTVLLHRLIPGRKFRSTLLLVASLLFYSFGGLTGLAILLISAVMNYLFAKLIAKNRGGKILPTLAVVANLALLIAYKYLNFFVQDVLGFQTKLSLIAPLGISFFTFKSISYLVDIYRKKTNPGSFWQFLLYLSFFPQVMAGPITRFEEFCNTLEQPDTGFDTFAQGLRRFVIGLSKKLLLAATLGAAADHVFGGETLSTALAWVGAVSYLLQIYFDFSGYSDMAIGLGLAFGLTAPENFRYPYIAPSVGDFWRRWHISLSSWFRDYLYIPLGGNRKGKCRTMLNKVIVFTLCGIWHGSAWTFLVWGLWHGLFTALESLLPTKKWVGRIPGRIVGHIYTLLVVMLGFVMFRAQSVEQGLQIICAMFTGTPAIPSATVLLHRIFTGEYVFALLSGAVLCLPLIPSANARLKRLAEPLSWIFCAFLFVLCL